LQFFAVIGLSKDLIDEIVNHLVGKDVILVHWIGPFV
jgi:hypothetical protein